MLRNLWLLAALSLTGWLTPLAAAQEASTTALGMRAEEGVYVVAYITDDGARRSMEDQLVADLAARRIIAHKSYPELPDLRAIDGKGLLSAARAKRVAAVVVVSPVAADENKRIDSPLRRSAEPDPEAFYEYTQWAEANLDLGGPVFAEVNAFAIIRNEAVLAWSGTAWSFEADGAGGAIRDISEEVADELVKIRNVVRAPD